MDFTINALRLMYELSFFEDLEDLRQNNLTPEELEGYIDYAINEDYEDLMELYNNHGKIYNN